MEFTGVRPVEDIQFVDFFKDDRLLDRSIIAAARSVGCASSESTCELIDLGGGDGLNDGSLAGGLGFLVGGGGGGGGPSSWCGKGNGFLGRHGGR